MTKIYASRRRRRVMASASASHNQPPLVRRPLVEQPPVKSLGKHTPWLPSSTARHSNVLGHDNDPTVQVCEHMLMPVHTPDAHSSLPSQYEPNSPDVALSS